MLVLSRERNQIIKIGDDIEIMIVDIRGDKVRLGINAPPNTTVHRQEVYDAIKREQERTNGKANSQSQIVGESGPGIAADLVWGA